jgi:uncharacterized membrane protein YdfJ with MMPL/SSD domain
VSAVERNAVLGFSWDFIDEVSVWSLVIGCAIAVVAGVMLESIPFAVGCLVAVGVDVALVRLSTRRARQEFAEGRIDAVAPTVMLAGRLVVKAGLLVIALFVPEDLAFAGTVVGALTFDVTLVVVGSIIAASRTMRRPKEGR